MSQKTTNIIGSAGENLTALRLEKDGYFKVYFLGDKAPIEDFLVEILDEKHPYHYLLQVKSTDKKECYLKNGNISTSVPANKLKKLTLRPLPTYVVGVDMENECIYIAPAFNDNQKYSSIPTNFMLDNENERLRIENLKKFRDDIIRYWEESDICNFKKNKFQSAL